MTSYKFQLNKEDLKKISKGAYIALGGALLTYLSSVIPNIDFGAWTPIVVAFWGIVINLLNKYLKETTY